MGFGRWPKLDRQPTPPEGSCKNSHTQNPSSTFSAVPQLPGFVAERKSLRSVKSTSRCRLSLLRQRFQSTSLCTRDHRPKNGFNFPACWQSGRTANTLMMLIGISAVTASENIKTGSGVSTDCRFHATQETLLQRSDEEVIPSMCN